MLYSVWSHGRLLGVTDLGFIYRPPRYRAGWFHPADDTQTIMDMATDLGPALHACFKSGGNALTDSDVQTAMADAQSLALELRDATGKVIETEHIRLVDGDRLPSIEELEDERNEEPDWMTSDRRDWLPEEDDEQAIVLDDLEDWEIPVYMALLKPENDWDSKDDEPWSEECNLPRYQISVTFVNDVALA